MQYPSSAIRPLFPVATGLAEDAVKLLEASRKPGATCTVAFIAKVNLLNKAVAELTEKAYSQLTPSLCGSKAEADEALHDVWIARASADYSVRHLESYRRQSAEYGIKNPVLCVLGRWDSQAAEVRAFQAELKDVTTHLLRFAVSCDTHGLCAD